MADGAYSDSQAQTTTALRPDSLTSTNSGHLDGHKVHVRAGGQEIVAKGKEDRGKACDGEEVSSREAGCHTGRLRPWQVYADTALALAVFLGSGFNFSIMCQTLLDLERITSSNTAQISEIFLWRGVGQMLGCICLGFIFDLINRHFLLGISMILVGVLQALMPFQRHAELLALLYGVQSVGVGLIAVGTTYVLVQRWKTKSGPFLQAQYLMYVIAGCLSPLIIRTYISQENSANEQLGNYSLQAEQFSNYSLQVEQLSNTSDPSLYSSALDKDNLVNLSLISRDAYNTKDSVMRENSTVQANVDIVSVYLLCAGYILIIGGLCLIAMFFSGPFFVKKTRKGTSTNELKNDIKTTKSAYNSFLTKRCNIQSIDKRNLLKVMVFTMMLTFETCIDCSFSSLVISFIVKELSWTQDDALLVSTGLFFTSGVTRLVAILLSKCISDLFIIVSNCVIATGGFIVMSTAIHLHTSVIWACAIAAGIACSTIIPSTLAWASNHVKMTGFVTSIFLAPLGTGLIFGPRVVGYFFQKHGPMWFPYMLCVYAIGLDVTFILALVAIRLFPMQKVDEYQSVNVQEEKYVKENEC